MAVFNDNSLSIGNTPLVRLARLTDAKVYAKLESRNPAFSVKCRIGAAIVWDAEQKGLLKPGMEIIEATSGNTGIALAFVGAARGYGVTLTMPASMSLERRKLLKVLGAKLVLTDPAKGMRGAVEKVSELVAENPGKYFEAKQFENPANPQIHFDTTGPEIWKDTNGEVDVFVSGVGTGGTLTGVSRYIKLKEGKKITTVAVEPAVSPLITQTRAGKALKPAPHKIQGIGANFVPKNLDLEMVDQVETVSNEDAIETARQLMLKEGILAGISCGAALAAALRVAAQPQHKDKTIVVVLPDSGERYLSSALFEGVFTEQELVQ